MNGRRFLAVWIPLGFRLGWTLVSLWLPAALLAASPPAKPDDIPPLRPPRAEIPPSFWEQHSGWVIAGGLLLLAFIGVGVWFLTRPKPSQPVPPEAQARQSLDALRSQPEDGLLLSRVSQVLRRYVAAAFGLPPDEFTTAEFSQAITGKEEVGAELAERLGDFLRRCDERKFAPAPPPAPPGVVPQALQLVELAETRRAQWLQAQQAAGDAAAQPPPWSATG